MEGRVGEDRLERIDEMAQKKEKAIRSKGGNKRFQGRYYLNGIMVIA